MAWLTPIWYWLIGAALGSFLILGAGCLTAHLCRQPIRRLRLLELTLAGCLLVPALLLVPGMPRWPVGPLTLPAESELAIPAGVEERVDAGREPLPRLVEPTHRTDQAATKSSRTQARPSGETFALGALPSQPTAVPATVVPEWVRAAWTSVPLFLVLAYTVAALGLALRRLVGLVQLRRLEASAYPAGGQAADIFQEIAGSAGAGVRLLASDRIELPLTYHGRRPVILLPGTLCRLGDTAALRFCLAHEWSHVERRDIRVWNLATLAQLLFFYQPLFWWLRRQLRLCQDFLADARAVEQASLAEDYANYLVAMARRRLRVSVLPALGIGDRRSNLYRRIIMLVHNQQPLERRCPGPWNGAITLAAVGLFAVVAGLRLEAGDQSPPKEADKAKPEAKKDVKGETLTYTGMVVEKGTGKPLEGATVIVRRSLYGDPNVRGENVVQETKHVTDAKGKYTFTIPPAQSREPYMYIELDVEHPTHAPRGRFGYSLAMIRKNEKIGGRPFFEKVEVDPGEAVTGTIQTPEGKPAAGVKILAYSKGDVSDFREYGSFGYGKTDAKGAFKVVIIKGGSAVFWILPQKYAPTTHVVKKKRGDQGLFVLQPGIRLRGKVLDAKGKPLAGVWVNANRERKQPVEDAILERVADSINRSALTDAKGQFEMNPLPPGDYEVKPDYYSHDSSKDRQPERELNAVFLPQKLTLKDGEKPDALEVRAVPHVIIEARYVDSKGKPNRGHEMFIFANMDNKKYVFLRAKPDANGRMRGLAPHGANVQLDLMTNEHGVLRHRLKPGGPLQNNRQVQLGVVNDDVKTIEIIRYVAPIVVVKVVAKGGGKVKDAAVTAKYVNGKGQYQGGLILKKGLSSDISFEEQEDGRFRSMQMFPDQEVTVTAQADGFEPNSIKVKLAEGAKKDVEVVLEKKK
jgi:beta-lactamase regulating signal transducer with metallopeptidase domain